MGSSTFLDNIIGALTAFMFACFSISNTNADWSTLSLLIITAIVLIINVLRRGLSGIHICSFHKSIFVFGIFCFASSLWAINDQDAIEKGTTIIEILLCMSVFFWVYSTIPDGFHRLLKAIMWGGYIITIFAFLTDSTSIIIAIMSGGRLPSSFDNVNAVGLLCAFSIIISVYFILNRNDWLLVVMNIPTLILLAACGSRKAMVILVAGCFAVYLMKSDNKNKKTIIFRLIVTVVLLFIVLSIISQISLFAGLNERMEGLIAMVTGEGEVDHSAMVRQEMSQLGYSIFFEHPIVGIGMGNAHIIDAKVLGEDCYLHNNYAEVLANGGIIGFCLYYGMYYIVLKKTKMLGGFKTDEGRILLIMLFSILVADVGLVSYYSKIYYFFLLAFNIYIYQKEYKR